MMELGARNWGGDSLVRNTPSEMRQHVTYRNDPRRAWDARTMMPHVHLRPQLQVEVKTKQLPSQETLFQLEVLEMNVQDLQSLINDEIAHYADVIGNERSSHVLGAMNHRPSHIGDPWDPIEGIAQPQQWRDDLKIQCREYLHADVSVHTLLYLIDSLDDLGLLREKDEDLAKRIGVDEDQMASARRILSSFSPGGFGFSNLPDFYMFQLESRGLLDRCFVNLLSSPNLEHMEQSRFEAVCSHLAIDQKELKKRLATLKTLRPYPSHGLDTGRAYGSPMRPDIIIQRHQSDLYFHLEESTSLEDAMANIRLKNANHPRVKRLERVFRAVHRRRLTIISVVECILVHQRDYFLGRHPYPKRLTRRTIAAETGRHESTIGRAIANKWVEWQGALMPLHHLISDRADRERGGRVPHHIKETIESIIQQEDRDKPYSDQQITALLRQQGIQLSRRTVASYRNALNIPPASVRRWQP